MKNTKPEIYLLHPNQWRDYKDVRLKALKSEPRAFGWTFEELAIKPDEYWIERLGNNEHLYFVAKLNSKIIGTAGLHLKSNGAGEKTACIVGIFVDKEFRRKGIAQKLLYTIFEKLTEYSHIEKVRVVVNHSQRPAIALYKKLGFKYVDRVDDEEMIFEIVLK